MSLRQHDWTGRGGIGDQHCKHCDQDPRTWSGEACETEPYRCIICGGREFEDVQAIWDLLEAVKRIYGDFIIIEGGAPGADRIANAWGWSNDIKVESYPADWGQYGKAAGPIRNQQMLDEGKPHSVYAFPDGPLSKSRGTRDMVTRAREAGIRTVVFGVDDLPVERRFAYQGRHQNINRFDIHELLPWGIGMWDCVRDM